MASSERLILAIFGALLISYVLTPVIRELARRRSLLDMPNHRSSHNTPIPRLGGAAIVPATMVGAGFLVDDGGWRLGLIGIGAFIIAVAGFYDDLNTITPVHKYAPQLMAAGMGAWATRPQFHIDLAGAEISIMGWPAVLVAAFWITAFINAFNFMDGIDGLAGGVGAVIALGLVLISSGNSYALLLPLAAALVGFLGWNTHPASIFMGDGGSQFVGYGLAIGALWWQGFEVPAVPVLLVFAPFLFDTGFTLLWRLWNRLNVFQAHRSHLYQRMTNLGYGHREVAGLYVAATALSAILAGSYQHAGTAGKLGVILVLGSLALIFVAWITRKEADSVSENASASPQARSQITGSQRRGVK